MAKPQQPKRNFRIVNPQPAANPTRRTEPIPWRLILITGAVSSLGALVIGDFYRWMKTRVANIGTPQQPFPAVAPPGHRAPAANFARGYDLRVEDEDDYDYEDDDDGVDDLWDRDEIEDRMRRLNRKEKELENREAEINERARKLRLIS